MRDHPETHQVPQVVADDVNVGDPAVLDGEHIDDLPTLRGRRHLQAALQRTEAPALLPEDDHALAHMELVDQLQLEALEGPLLSPSRQRSCYAPPRSS